MPIVEHGGFMQEVRNTVEPDIYFDEEEDAPDPGSAASVELLAVVVDDVLSKRNKIQRLLIWARLLRVSPPTLQTFQQIGSYCGVSRQAICKDENEIKAKHPYLKLISYHSDEHDVTNKSNFKLKG